MGQSRIDLLTFGGFLALFFATSAIETLRAALNGAYRVQETRPYPVPVLSMMLVLLSAISMLVMTWAVLVGPGPGRALRTLLGEVAARLELARCRLPLCLRGRRHRRPALRLPPLAHGRQAHHHGRAARRALSVVLWLTIAGFYSYYLNFSDYTRFYAGLSQLMGAMIFFQFTAIIIILGAELNRGIMELKKLNGS